MDSSLFFHQLAIERCQHSLAQLCAVTYMVQDLDSGDLPVGAEHYQTIRALIERINSDLAFLQGGLSSGKDLGGALNSAGS